MNTCKNCHNIIPISNKYCNNQCQQDYQYKEYIALWKAGKISGLVSGNSNTVVSNAVKKFLMEKYDNKCCICEWSKINPFTGKVPLVADHIDGNYLNNVENNLRLICWNCDSLSEFFGGLNRGKGRKNRKR